MSRKLQLCCALAGLLALSGIGFYAALHGAPSFYSGALRQDPAAAARASDEFLQRATGVLSDVRKPGAWEAVITAEQINGWLAVDVPNNFPDLTPPDFSDPRISISPGDITFAGRSTGSRLNTVLSISCNIYLSAPNVIAIRVKSMRAGLVPLPLGQALEAITHAAQAMGMPLEWRRDGGDPVALISIVSQDSDFGRRRNVAIDRIELRDGEIAVVGQTGAPAPLSTATRLKPAEASPQLPAPRDDAPQSDDLRSGSLEPAAENETLQR